MLLPLRRRASRWQHVRLPQHLLLGMTLRQRPRPGREAASRFLSSPMARCAAQERRREADGSLRVVYAARMCRCRPCPLRAQDQWQGKAPTKPRQVSILPHPLQVGPAPLLWRGWSRCEHWRACMRLLRSQRVDVHLEPSDQVSPATKPSPLSRTQ
ncbi:MAG TPA: hypothetical protein VFV38_40310 [Ktedonobacteraceae bacterium]|nr:hypothetical protein [Ktedonobacteraceae bacterium]